MTELDGGNFVRETLQQFVSALLPIVTRTYPTLPHPERRVTFAVAALEGAISYVVFESPLWLLETWLLDELVALGVGYLRQPPSPGA